MELLLGTATGPGAWHPRGATALSAWLRDRPWCSTGGVRGVRVADEADATDEVADAIRRMVRVIDDGATEVRVARLAPATAFHDPVAALAEAVGCAPPSGDARARVRGLGRLLDSPPWVFVVTPGDAPPPGAFSALVDDLQRLTPPVALTVVGLTTAASREADDFVHGAPWAPMPAALGAEDWRWYLRLRAAWEAAGRLDLVTAWWPALSGLVPGDDAALERVLNACATERWRALAGPAREAFVRWCDRVETAQPRGGEALGPDLDALFWPPDAQPLRRPAAWAARALLVGGHVSAGHEALRRALVCAPLTREILGRCIDLEAAVRARLPVAGAVRADTQQSAARYLAPGTAEQAHYPDGCPGMPRSPWAFASLGEFIAAAPLDATRWGVLHDLRGLRNHLAHGHYASWQAVRSFRRLEAVLA